MKSALQEIARLHSNPVSSVKSNEFLRFVQQRSWMRVQTQVQKVEQLLKTYWRKPEYWAVDCEQYVKDLLELAVKPEYGVPADLRLRKTTEETLALTQRLVRKYGELLIAWPDMLEAAKHLRQKGVVLARPL